jgi:hypothetical protein
LEGRAPGAGLEVDALEDAPAAGGRRRGGCKWCCVSWPPNQEKAVGLPLLASWEMDAESKGWCCACEGDPMDRRRGKVPSKVTGHLSKVGPFFNACLPGVNLLQSPMLHETGHLQDTVTAGHRFSQPVWDCVLYVIRSGLYAIPWTTSVNQTNISDTGLRVSCWLVLPNLQLSCSCCRVYSLWLSWLSITAIFVTTGPDPQTTCL